MTTTLSPSSPDGTLRPAAGNRPLRLDADARVDRPQGRIDVFATRLTRTASPTGPRRHLFRLEAGDPVFGRGRGPRLRPRPAGRGRAGDHAGGVSRWRRWRRWRRTRDPRRSSRTWCTAGRERVWDGLVGRATVRRATGGRPARRCAAQGLQPAPGRAVVWMEPLEGDAAPAGPPRRARGRRRDAPRHAPRLGGGAWTPRAGAAAGHGRRAGRRGRRGRCGAALALLHHAAMELAVERARADEAAYRERLQAREQAQAAGMAGGLSRLASTLQTAEQRLGMRMRPPEGAGEDTLFAAFRLVAEAQGLRRGAAGARPPQAKDPIQALARACRVRARRVVLREGWWRADNGPLLGRWADTPAPLALLPCAAAATRRTTPPRARACRLDEAVGGAGRAHGVHDLPPVPVGAAAAAGRAALRAARLPAGPADGAGRRHAGRRAGAGAAAGDGDALRDHHPRRGPRPADADDAGAAGRGAGRRALHRRARRGHRAHRVADGGERSRRRCGTG